jgi:cytochrome c oxidase assembly factor CtaG
MKRFGNPSRPAPRARRRGVVATAAAVRLDGMVLGAVLVLFAGVAGAHGVDEAKAGIDWDPFLFAWIVGAALLYLVGLARMGRPRRARLLGRFRAASYALGTAGLLVALLSPLDALADQLFSAHMTQHIVLLLVAPPLLVVGRPWLVWLWALDLARRRRIGRACARLRRSGAARVAVGPVAVWTLLTLVLWFWHLPDPYAWALADRNVHLVEHLSFFFVSIAFFILVVEPYRSARRRRMGYGTTILYVASIGLQNGLLGALLTFANHPLYAAHAAGSHGLTGLEDQQLAGLIMWVPAGTIHLAALSMLFVRWLDNADAFTAEKRGEQRSAQKDRKQETPALSSASSAPPLR